VGDSKIALNLDRADWPEFSKFLENVSGDVLTECKLARARSPATATEEINDILTQTLLTAAMINIPAKSGRLETKPWWNAVPGVLSALKRLRRAARRKRRYKTQAAKANLAAARQKCRSIVKSAKAASWTRFCSRIVDPSRRLNWKVFNRATGQSISQSLASISNPGQALPGSLVEALDRFAAHYSSVSAAKPPSPDDEEILRFVHSKSRNAAAGCLDGEFTEANLNHACKSLHKSAGGADLISPLFIKHAPPAFKRCLLVLYNHSWATGQLPAAWRHANVCPIFKGGGAPADAPKSFRPISLTSCIVKVFERMIYSRLVSFLDARGFFSRFQAGFRAHHSTLDQLYRLFDRVKLAFARTEYVTAVFLDVVAAFDSVWHEGLLYKLHRAGSLAAPGDGSGPFSLTARSAWCQALRNHAHSPSELEFHRGLS